MTAVRADIDVNVPKAREEMIRYCAPAQWFARTVRKPFTVHDTTIEPGQRIITLLASANRDERQFENPDQLDITRENNKHLAFGHGVHYCEGAPLARLEGQIAIPVLVQQMPSLRLRGTADTLRWRAGMTVRGLEALPVAAR
jgi:cytochrome P450